MRVSDKRFRALKLLRDAPGLTAAEFASQFWPHLQSNAGVGRMIPALRAAQWLRVLLRHHLVRWKWNPDIFEFGGRMPRRMYYLTSLGYEVCENEDRARRSCGSRSPARRA
jgi:hypothetical protein